MLPQGHVPSAEGQRREEHGVIQASTAAGNNFSAAIFIQLCRCLLAIAPLDSSMQYSGMERAAQTPGLPAVLGHRTGSCAAIPPPLPPCATFPNH